MEKKIKTTYSFTQKEVEIIEDALIKVGLELSEIVEGYVWPIELSRKWTKANNILVKKLKSSK